MSIKLKNSYFEIIMANQETFNGILNKPFPAKTGYWIGRAIDKIQSQSKTYFDAKQRLIKQYAEIDGEGNLKANVNKLSDKEIGSMASILNKERLDEVVMLCKIGATNESVLWSDEKGGFAAFIKELGELQEIEIDLGMDEIEVDFDLLENWQVLKDPITGETKGGITISPIEAILMPFLKPKDV